MKREFESFDGKGKFQSARESVKKKMGDFGDKAKRSNSWDNFQKPPKFDWNKMNENMKGFDTGKFKKYGEEYTQKAKKFMDKQQ